MPTKKKKKTKVDKTISVIEKITKAAKKLWEIVKELFAQKIVKIGLVVVIAVMLMLGLTINWNCGSRGWNCGGGYRPPKPEDVNKILKMKPGSVQRQTK